MLPSALSNVAGGLPPLIQPLVVLMRQLESSLPRAKQRIYSSLSICDNYSHAFASAQVLTLIFLTRVLNWYAEKMETQFDVQSPSHSGSKGSIRIFEEAGLDRSPIVIKSQLQGDSFRFSGIHLCIGVSGLLLAHV